MMLVLTMKVWVGLALLSSAMAQDACFTAINTLALRESGITDTSSTRTYTLCANNEFSVGTLDFDYNIENGQEMIPLRPNLYIKCGDDGSRENNCIVKGGEVLVDGTDHFGVWDDTLDNVVIEGITFEDVGRHVAWFNKKGTVTFRDCEFRNNRRAMAAILLDYFNNEERSSELSVTFENCIFDQNRYYGMPAQPAVVVGNGRQNRLIIEKTMFSNNNFVVNNTKSSTNSYLIETSGPLTLIDSCFENNTVGVSPVVVYGTEHMFADNYESNSRGAVCGFASRFETEAQFNAFAPVCTANDAQICYAFGTDMPSVSPSPSAAPSPSPSDMPSNSPTFSPPPSLQPSEGPTGVPTASPSSAPSATPTVTPVPTSTSRPTAGPTTEAEFNAEEVKTSAAWSLAVGWAFALLML